MRGGRPIRAELGDLASEVRANLSGENVKPGLLFLNDIPTPSKKVQNMAQAAMALDAEPTLSLVPRLFPLELQGNGSALHMADSPVPDPQACCSCVLRLASLEMPRAADSKPRRRVCLLHLKEFEDQAADCLVIQKIYFSQQNICWKINQLFVVNELQIIIHISKPGAFLLFLF
ncbi:hypothetical protein ZWY2020_002059 [Hordeum vulgare]|nr:hypothetical protein ZWY2020_002059 [Hordeum vulgare]